MQTAPFLQRLLTEEGAFFHPAMRVLSLPSMGGGYGVVATEPLKPGTLLAKIPHGSMITVRSARRYLAFFECEHRQILSDGSLFSDQKTHATALSNIERELSRRLSPANNIICYLLLIAAQHGRFASSHTQDGIDVTDVSPGESDKSFIGSNHAWMRRWILSLPTHYDNLLELRPEWDEEDKPQPNGDNNNNKLCSSTNAYLRPYLWFERHRQKVLREQASVEAEFQLCQSVLSVLKAMPQSSNKNKTIPASLKQFLWAYNTLMSRGFSYDDEVWALIPWVDYFNYALTSNATMRFDEKRDAYIFETLLPINGGEQILLHYGSYTDMELLLWYGFTLTPSLLPELVGCITREEREQKLRIFFREDFRVLNVDEASSSNRDDAWLTAVNRALGYCFSPWANADGSYPHPKAGELWLELLLASYMSLRSKESGRSGGDSSKNLFPPTAEAADVLAKTFLGLRTPNMLPAQLIASDCSVGLRGPSPSMRRLLKYVSRVCSTNSSEKHLTPGDVLRAICWAELYCNDNNNNNENTLAMESFVQKKETIPPPVNGVKAMAWQASLDAAALLHLLAVEATEEELNAYLTRKYLKENKMPEPTVSITPETAINCSQLLEGFLSMYALQCKESAIEMNPRVLQAAIAMQDADEKRKRDSHISDVRTLTPAYILNTMQIGSSDLQALFPALSCTPLAKLDLTDCCIGDTGIRTLTELLSSSSRCGGVIRSIHLSGVGISDASPLGYFVTAAKQLQTLNISRNRIGTQPHGLAVLCAALRHHRSMRDVNFSDNLISGSCNISMRSIAEWLVCAGHDDVLYSIDLRFNALGILKKVVGCIVHIPTVAKEGMGSIYGSHPLVDALVFNNTLESLELYGNGLSADVLDVIEAKLAVNRRAKAILRKSTHPPSTTIDCTK